MADLIHQRQRAAQFDGDPQAQAYQAEVVDAPASLNSKVTVTVPGIDDGMFEHAGAPWMPRTGAVQETPEAGDRALVVFDDTGMPWVVAWWPEGVL